MLADPVSWVTHNPWDWLVLSLDITHMYMYSCSVVTNSLWPYGRQPSRLFCAWNVPGKNTGVAEGSGREGGGKGDWDGEYMYIQGWFMSMYDKNHYNTVISLQLILKKLKKKEYWSGLPLPTPGESLGPRDWTQVSRVYCIGRWLLYHWATWETPLGVLTVGKFPQIWSCLTLLCKPRACLPYSNELCVMEQCPASQGHVAWDHRLQGAAFLPHCFRGEQQSLFV